MFARTWGRWASCVLRFLGSREFFLLKLISLEKISGEVSFLFCQFQKDFDFSKKNVVENVKDMDKLSICEGK